EARHRLRPQRIDAHARVEGGMRLGDKAAGAQLAKVAAQGGRAEADRLRQLAGAARPLAQGFDDLAALRGGEGQEDRIERGGRRRHAQPSILSPLAFSASSRETVRTLSAKVQTWPSGSRAL